MNNLIKVCMGCPVTAVGILVLRHTNMITGGTAGLSLNLTYLFDLSFFVNLPFYIFALLTMGWKFTCKTLNAICILTLFTVLDSFTHKFSISNFKLQRLNLKQALIYSLSFALANCSNTLI